MAILDSRYPEALQRAIDDALSWSTALRAVEADPAPKPERERAWVIGRGREIEVVVEGIVFQWKQGKLTEEKAAASVALYVQTLAAAAARYLEPSTKVTSPADEEVGRTAPQTPYDGDLGAADTLTNPAALADPAGTKTR